MTERTFKLTLAYNGAAYSGWQLQAAQPTVQGAVEKALQTITGRRIVVHGSGRTDSGVHALGQVASFDLATDLAEEKLSAALESLTPDDIQVVELREVDSGFHARYDAVGKCYRYHVWLGGDPPLFYRPYLWPVTRRIDPDRLAGGLDSLRGEHDFAGFQTAGSPVKTTVRRLDTARSVQTGRLLTFEFRADGFLRHQVRAMVGSLMTGFGREKITAALTGGDRALGGKTAPAAGLFLVWVKYNGHGAPRRAAGPFDDINRAAAAEAD